MKCPKCGNNMLFSDEYKIYYCQKCGMKLRPVKKQPNVAPETPPKAQPMAQAEVPPEEVPKEEFVDASSFNAPYKSFTGKFALALAIVFFADLIFGLILATAKLSPGGRLFIIIVFALLCIVLDILLICFICGIVIDKYHHTRMDPVIKKIEELENKLAEKERNDKK